MKSRAAASRFTLEIATASTVAIFGVVIVYGALRHGIGWTPDGPATGYVPFYLGIIIAAAGLGILLQTLATHAGASETFVTREQARRLVGVFVPIVGTVLLAQWIGLYLAMIVYIAGSMRAQGGFTWLTAAAVSVGTATFFFLVFEIWLRSPLLKGPLENWLGFY